MPFTRASYVRFSLFVTPALFFMRPIRRSGAILSFASGIPMLRAMPRSSGFVRRVAWRLLMRRILFRPIFTTC